LKPTYRDWSITHRNNEVQRNNEAQRNQQSSTTERETRLHNLREKLKKKYDEKPSGHSKNTIETINPIVETQINISSSAQEIRETNPEDPIDPNHIIATKKITKRTIKKKYTLGKSKIKNTVAVLIKDKGTRKKVIDAQRELKKKNINDIKLYLAQHNLIKAGSRAPNDVFRKMYESAMLSGDITNTNTDTLLHNFAKSDGDF
jgi:hypothetical protein